jgi:hypothetical protein
MISTEIKKKMNALPESNLNTLSAIFVALCQYDDFVFVVVVVVCCSDSVGPTCALTLEARFRENQVVTGRR